jgi:hypothetical protein
MRLTTYCHCVAPPAKRVSAIDDSETDCETRRWIEASANQRTVRSNLTLVWTNICSSYYKPCLRLMRPRTDCTYWCFWSTFTPILSPCFSHNASRFLDCYTIVRGAYWKLNCCYVHQCCRASDSNTMSASLWYSFRIRAMTSYCKVNHLSQAINRTGTDFQWDELGEHVIAVFRHMVLMSWSWLESDNATDVDSDSQLSLWMP